MGKDFSFAIRIDETAPTLGNTTILFNSETSWGLDALPALDVKRISFEAFHDQAGTLKAFRKSRGATTWDQYDTQVIGIPPANTITGPFDYLIDTFWNWKLEWLNGGVTQTTWRPSMHGHENRMRGD